VTRTIRIRSNDREEVLANVRRVLRNPEAILKQVGAALQANAQRAFRDQRLGNDAWPEQYPGQDDPFVHTAGLVADLAGGSKISSRRLERSPRALFDTGELFRSLDDQGQIDTPDQFTVEVGTNVTYASVHQYGGTSTQPVNDLVREGVRDFISTAEGVPYFLNLFWLTSEDVTELETDVNMRPFLGVAGAEERIREIVEEGITDEPTRPG